MSNRKSNLSVQYMTRIAILGALSAILFMIEIPVIAFYKLDVSTLPALLGAFSMGPMAGISSACCTLRPCMWASWRTSSWAQRISCPQR